MREECPACGRDTSACRCDAETHDGGLDFYHWRQSANPDFWAGAMGGFLVGLLIGALLLIAAILSGI